ncbi:unnamed protein product [Effrenium voratum]|nr:unnamed protein product [Effrenium voratum]
MEPSAAEKPEAAGYAADAGAAAPAAGAVPAFNPELVKEAMEAVAQATAATEEKPQEKFEDLELRASLAKLSEGPPEGLRQELANAAKILRRLSEDVSNVKLHAMRRDVLERTVGEGLFFTFEAAGFKERVSDNGPVLQWQGPDHVKALKEVLAEVQRAADLLHS